MCCAVGSRPAGYSGGQLLWTLAHEMINRLMYAMSAEAKASKVAVVTLMPGFMRTERVQQYLNTRKTRKMIGYDLAESTEYIGRAVAALAARDRQGVERTEPDPFCCRPGKRVWLHDVDGRVVPRFNPHAAAQT